MSPSPSSLLHRMGHGTRRGMFRRLAYAPFLVQMVVVRRCNLKCGYCNEFDDSSAPVPFEELQRRLDKLDALGAFAVEFTGGEPLLHPRLVDLVAYAKTKRFRKVMLLSNGFLFSSEMIEALNRAGLDDLQISIDGVEPNAVTVKTLTPLRPKLEALARRAAFRVTINGVVGSTASEDVLEVIGFAKAHKFQPRVCLIHSGDGILRISPEQSALYREVKRAIGRRFAEAGDYRSRLMETGKAPFRCRAGSRYLYVDEFGVVRWCSQQMASFGKPLAEYGPADLKRQFHTMKSCSDGCTVGCVRTCSAYDAWRPQRLSAPPPGEPVQPLFTIRPGAPPVSERD
jgi:MoaA/NifB/PqqE/SkfB family radical SAM enzyme